jgi:hypothetical protein
MAMSNIVNKVVGVAVGLLMIALLVPLALSELAKQEAELTTLDPVVKTVLFILTPILAILSLAIYFLPGRR